MKKNKKLNSSEKMLAEMLGMDVIIKLEELGLLFKITQVLKENSFRAFLAGTRGITMPKWLKREWFIDWWEETK